jgi:26S proteasome regulatory subunit N1
MAPKDQSAVELTASTTPTSKTKGGKEKGDVVLVDTLSDEDRELKERLETCVATILSVQEDTSSSSSASTAAIPNQESLQHTMTIKSQALQMISMELRTATASMTSVPKPLKFLRPHYQPLKVYYYDSLKKHELTSTTTSTTVTTSQPTQSVDDNAIQGMILLFRAQLADVMAVLAITMGTPDGT